MSEIFVTSDTHFFHDYIIKFDPPRPFSTIDEHDEALIENWNSVVRAGDLVIHLGDVFWGNKEKFKSMWPRLAGKKELIVGNHDDIPWLSKGAFFKKVHLWKVLTDFKLVLTHIPMHVSQFHGPHTYGTDFKNVHGHIHSNPAPSEHHINVSVDVTNYTPVNLEELRVK
mgnify:CR=1 FL=1